MDIIAIIALIIAIIAFILAILIMIWFTSYKNRTLNSGIPWEVQQGTLSATTDTMKVNGNNFYIGKSTSDLTLTVTPDGNNEIGAEFQVYNNSTNTITIVPGTGISLDTTLNGTTVSSGDTAIFIAAGSTNEFVRVQ